MTLFGTTAFSAGYDSLSDQCGKNSDGNVVFCGKIKIAYFKLTNSGNNTILREMYPAKRKSDNKPGMYDIANNAFYTNMGTGEFTMGPAV